MSAIRGSVLLCVAAALPVCISQMAWGKVTVLQNGVSPSADYAGCRDTWISNEPWETGRDLSRSLTLHSGGKRAILMAFDLSPIPKEEVVHRAVLRLADAGYPHQGRDGKYPAPLTAYRLSRQWNENANWTDHTRRERPRPTGNRPASLPTTDPAFNWETPGGDIDDRTDFGQGANGLIASDAVTAGPWGHAHELDVTAIVRQWLAGKTPDHGLLLTGGACAVASSDWPVAAYRPQLIIDHGPRGGQPTSIPALEPAPKEVELDAVSATGDIGGAKGDYVTVRVGKGDECAYGGETSADAYIKENVAKFPGNWGWMDMLRVGGAAGDFSRTLLYFDLGFIPKEGSIKSARLHVALVPWSSREATEYRYGAFLVKLSDAPGWSAGEVIPELAKAGTPWPKGGLLAASGGKPLALAKITTKEIDQQGRKQRVNDGLDFDLTGAVRAWVSGKVPNCGLVLDNRIEGGAYDIFSARTCKLELRPYLEITLACGLPAASIVRKEVKPALPPGDYWVEPMRQVHKLFKGKPGTLSQYGDSITVTGAYLAPYGYAKKIEPKNCPPDVKQEMEVVEKYADLSLWVKWKEAGYGNTGMMRSDWLFNNIDGWQKKMNAEAAVILFGTNDLGGLMPPQYTENMAASLRRMMADGTVPMLTTVPPASGRPVAHEYWLALLSVAHGLKVPVIDYYAETLRRRPDDWDGRLPKFKDTYGKDEYQVKTIISADGTHPSNPKDYVNDFSAEALSNNGYNLRNYMTLRMYSQVITKVFQAERK